MFYSNIQYQNNCSTTNNRVNSNDYYPFDYQCNQYTKPEAVVSTSEDSNSQSKQYSDIDMDNNSMTIGKDNSNDHDIDVQLNEMNSNYNCKVGEDIDECMESKKTVDANSNHAVNALQCHGYIYHKRIGKTLQGEIFEAINTNNNNEIVVIKKAIKKLVNENVTIRNGVKIKIQENINREIQIMKYLNNGNDIPSEHIKLIDLFEDEKCIYVVTEHGGCDFFQWIVTAHKQIENGQLSIRYWWKNIKYLFKQMVNYVIWLQETMNICHLDLSLENMLLQNGDYFYKKGKFTRSQQIKICDFGLSEYFDTSVNPSFTCDKHVGKESYMAPELYSKSQSFDARQADAWSLGVILFIMMSGAPAYEKPDIINDSAFQYIICQKIPALLASWRRLNYIDPLMLDLLQKIFILDPSKRLTVQQIKNHAWLQSV